VGCAPSVRGTGTVVEGGMGVTKFRSPFSYYGGKSKIAHLYPPPKHDKIVEPFAGSGAYSFLYWERDITVNDLDPITASIWRFLVSDSALDDVELMVPAKVKAGQKVSDLLPQNASKGLLALLRAEANRGTQGGRGVHDQITSMAEKCWNGRLKRKLLEEVIPRVSHWKVTSQDYTNLPDVKATWFIDPPYSNTAGKRYRTCEIDYEELARWTCNRKGETIVCENQGADWLPFDQLGSSARGIKSRYQHRDAQEVIFHAS
jgi:site-specific DNA-adenine methylase